MKSSVRIPLRVAAGFAADPDPRTSPQLVPPDHVFTGAESLPVDGAPNVLLAWLSNAAAAETATVEVWGLDDDTALDLSSSPGSVYQPSVDHRWSRLVAATLVTSPAVQAFTGRLFAGRLYVRQTASALTVADTLKVNPARL